MHTPLLQVSPRVCYPPSKSFYLWNSPPKALLGMLSLFLHWQVVPVSFLRSQRYHWCFQWQFLRGNWVSRPQNHGKWIEEPELQGRPPPECLRRHGRELTQLKAKEHAQRAYSQVPLLISFKPFSPRQPGCSHHQRGIWLVLLPGYCLVLLPGCLPFLSFIREVPIYASLDIFLLSDPPLCSLLPVNSAMPTSITGASSSCFCHSIFSTVSPNLK